MLKVHVSEWVKSLRLLTIVDLGINAIMSPKERKRERTRIATKAYNYVSQE